MSYAIDTPILVESVSLNFVAGVGSLIRKGENSSLAWIRELSDSPGITGCATSATASPS